MKLYTSLESLTGVPCVLALGCFDGLHIGHQAVIESARRLAEKLGLPLAVLTFSSPPKSFFSPESTLLITPPEQKPQIFEALGVDICICLSPSREIFSISADIFINEVIIDKLCARAVACGYNYTFGSGALGDAQMLKRACRARGVEVCIVPEQMLGGDAVSSSLVRECVANGEVERAAELLGRPFSVSDTVIDGQHLASTLGFPTVNILPQRTQLLPKNGVYVSRICFDGECRYGISNVGVRPTVDTKIMCVEAHIFDFEGNLYGKRVSVEFLHFLREERKFDGISHLSEQIHRDIASAREYIKANG